MRSLNLNEEVQIGYKPCNWPQNVNEGNACKVRRRDLGAPFLPSKKSPRRRQAAFPLGNREWASRLSELCRVHSRAKVLFLFGAMIKSFITPKDGGIRFGIK